MARTLITNGTVVSPTGRQSIDVLIEDEKIVALYAPGQVSAQGVSAERTIDATGKYVIPIVSGAKLQVGAAANLLLVTDPKNSATAERIMRGGEWIAR